MHSVASIASLGGKFKNSTGSKAVIQALRDDFDPLQISELTGYASPESMTAIVLELWKNSGDCQKSWPVLMSHKHDNYQQLFKSCFTEDCSQKLNPAKQHSSY